MDNNLILFVGILDSFHDFYTLDSNNNNECFINLFKFLKLNSDYQEKINIKFDNPIKYFAKADNINFKNKITDGIFNKVNASKKNISTINNQIIHNFNELLNFKLENTCFNSDVNFNTLLSDGQKIMLRLQLYWLIKNKLNNNIIKEIIGFLIKYMNLDVLNATVIEQINQKIIFNLTSKKYENIVYPLTYFDDTNIGLNKKYFKFNILNLDKQYIDGASTTGILSYFKNNDNDKGDKNLTLSDKTLSVGFIVDDSDVIELLGFKWYLHDKKIVCKYNNVEIKFVANIVGRSLNSDNNGGIYQLTVKIIKMYTYIFKKIKSNTAEQIILEYKLKIFEWTRKILKTFNDIKLFINTITDFNFDSHNDKIMEVLKSDYGYVKKDIRTILNKKQEILKLVENYNVNVANGIRQIMSMKKFNNNKKVINLFIDNINGQIELLKKLGLNVNHIEKISNSQYEFTLIKYVLGDSINNKIKIDENILTQLLFFDKCSQIKNEIEEIIFIDDLHIQLVKVYECFSDNLDIGLGFLVFAFFGVKRFGDWIQMYLSKKHWFILQTNDFYCQLYGYLIGAPVIFTNEDDIIYNYLPPDDLVINDKILKVVSPDSVQSLSTYTGEKKLVYKGLRDVKTPDLSRMYFSKYLKYKKKYLQLKQLGGQGFSDPNINLYLKFTTEKLVALLPEEITNSVGGGEKRKAQETFQTPGPQAKVSRYPIRIRNQPSYLADYVQDLTPQILRYLTPNSKTRMQADIEVDNQIIKTLECMEESDDSDYVQYENYGKLIECWIGDNIQCPCCGAPNSLRRYLSDSMPVIDLVCINPAHTLDQGVRFFQVKASNGSLFLSKPYFNLDLAMTTPEPNTIHVGSRVWGEPVHMISPHANTFTKKILCGYICICYKETESTLKLNLKNSFIVLPKYLNSIDTVKQTLTFNSEQMESSDLQIDDWYYRYITPNGHHERIQFNLSTNNIITGNELKKYIPSDNINKLYEIKTTSMPNPLNVLK